MLVYLVFWVLVLNIYVGFFGVLEILCMVGCNYGLCGLCFVLLILVLVVLLLIFVGLKIGWVFVWCMLIVVELVFGVSSGKGGFGWYIF